MIDITNQNEIYPTDMYIVKTEFKTDYLNDEILTLLYQPIIGFEAYCLYMFLCREQEMEFHPHGYICSALNININQFLKMKSKLEGIGLLRSYRKKDNKNYTFIYRLQPPLSPKEIFDDELFSTLLLDAVNEDRFNQLMNRFTYNVTIPKDYEEITSQFYDSYSFSNQHLASYHNKFEDNIQNIKADHRKLPKIVTEQDFDFEELLKSLNNRIIDIKSVIDIKKTVLTLKNLYNLSVEELKLFINKSADVQTGKVDEKILQKQIVAAKKITTDYRRENNETVEMWRQKGISQNIIDVFLVAKSTSPIDFLSSIKKQKGGQQTAEEFFILRSASEKSQLPISVINIVIYYFLVEKNQMTLSQKEFDKTLDYLGQNNLIELSEVWSTLQQLTEKANNKQSKQYNKTKQTIRNKNKKVIDSEWQENSQSSTIDEEKYQSIMDDLNKL